MKTRLLPFRRWTVLPAMIFCASGAVLLAAPEADAVTGLAAPATAVSPPAAPVPPRSIAFSDRVSGRRLLFATRDAYRDAPSLRVSAKWTLVGPDGNATTGTETILAQFGQGKLALTSETDGTAKTVRRAIANGVSSGGTLLVTQYKAATPNPTRQFSRYPLDQTIPLARSLQMAQFRPTTMAGEMLLTSEWRLQTAALVYVSRPDSAAGSTAVIQTDLPAGGDRAQNKVTRRYLVDSKTNRLRRYEEWRTTQVKPRPATRRLPADNGMRVTYHREDYTEGTAPVTAAVFSQALPAGYTEQTPAAVTLPPVPREVKADPRALALLRRWQTAHERYLTLNAVADIRTESQQRTEISRPARGPVSWGRLATIWRMRPGQARIVVNEIDPRTQQPNLKADYVVVADGQRVRYNDYEDGRSNTDRQRDPAVVPFNRMRQVLRQAWDSGIDWVFDGPPSAEEFSEITLDSSSPTPTLVFTQTFDNGNDRGRKSETQVSWRVTLGPDNLPREMISRRVTNIVGAFERDQPPTFTTTVRLQRMAVDVEPLPETFTLPEEIARR